MKGGGMMKQMNVKPISIALLLIFSTASVFSQSITLFKDVKVKASLVQDPGFSAPNVKLVPANRDLQ